MNFTHRTLTIILISIVCFCITGCGKDTPVTKEKIEAIELSMDLSEVEEIMGGPGKIKTFEGQKKDSKFYYWEDPNNSNYIYVGILDGKVASISASPFS